jgi:hypothetical protein
MKTKQPPADPQPVDQLPHAYSYLRFSSPEQARGDTIRRQKEATRQWCERHGVTLDKVTSFRDMGKSAFTGKHRENPDRHALAAFLELVERGRVPRGSFLIIENLDRLTREHVRAGLMLCLGLIEQGISLVQLSPTEIVYDEKSDEMSIMLMIVELSRGHRESVIKSERVGGAWQEKLRRVRRGEAQKATKFMGDNCYALTRTVPAWIEVRDGKLHLIPERAAVVKRIYQLSAAGFGTVSIVRKLTEEKVPPFGEREWHREEDEDGNVREGWRTVPGKRFGAGWWTKSYVCLMLNDRRVLGEYQPRKGDGTPDGDPIPNYFPAVVTKKEYDLARAGMSRRRQETGRTTKHINIFAGLVINARDGDTYYVATRTSRGLHHHVLINTASAGGRAQCWSFPYITFERAMLSMLREVQPKDVLGEDDAADEEAILKAERDRVVARIAEYEAELDNGELAVLARKLRELQDRKTELDRLIAEASRKAARPLCDVWDDAKSILKALEKAPDTTDFRVRLRTTLRRMIDSIWVVFDCRAHDRYAFVQVCFAGGGRSRDYFIAHRPTRRGFRSIRCGSTPFYKPGMWVALSVDLEAPKHRRKGTDLREYQSDPAVRKFIAERPERHQPALEQVFAGGQKQWDTYAKAGKDLPADFPPLEMHEDWGPHAQFGYLEPLGRSTTS